MLKIQPTTKTPAVEFNSNAGELRISGKSIAENPADFFEPVLEKIKQYKQKPGYQTNIHIALEYFNTGSSRSLLEILQTLEPLKSTSEVTIHWYYEKQDDDMLEIGNDFSEIVKLQFKMIEV
ncbi:MAG: DUF1987 domain-containing protein [Bacteroidia bacterium]